MKSFLPKSIFGFLAVANLLFFSKQNFAQAPNLRSAANFVLFTPTGAVGSTGISNITGNVGSNNGAITGFGTLNGLIYNADAITAQCTIDVLSVCRQLDSTVSTLFPGVLLGDGQVLNAGVYAIPAATTLNANLTLDAQGNPNAVFIFKIVGAFSTNASSSITLVNGAIASNVFWKAEGAVAMAAGTIMRGTVIANDGAISMGDGGILEGRALSNTGAVSVYGTLAFIPINSILSATLIDFRAALINHTTELLWTTANEFALDRFELEKSSEGHKFYKIESVGATNTDFVKTYIRFDEAAHAGISFYRLKIINMDGGFKYSAIAKIDMNAMKDISVYPNPVANHVLMLQMVGQLKGNYTITLYNNAGEKVMSSSMAHDGNDAVRSIILDKNLPKSVYYLEARNAENNNKTIKVLIN